MFCAIFNRLLLLLEYAARVLSVKNNTMIVECNKWFETNHFFIEFKEEENIRAKVTTYQLIVYIY
jgi:uncharacterized protein (DUF1330 family)